MNNNTIIVAETTSRLDRQPIVVLATGFNNCHNRKLGHNFIQTFYLRQDIHPKEAVNSGEDYSICGDCPFRPVNHNICYVGHHVLGNMWKSYRNGNYRRLNKAHLTQMSFHKKPLRLGAYGEAVSVPLSTVKPLIEAAPFTVGYSHQWSRPDLADEYRGYLQASVETVADAIAATKMGWKYFRVKQVNQPKLTGEIVCPNTTTVPPKQCQDCKLCTGDKANIVIDVHGGTAKAERYSAYLASLKNEN